MPDQTDEEIAMRVQRGDSESFGTLVARYEERLMRYAARFLLRGDDGKDVAQDAFLKAYANIQSFDLKRKFSSWMYRIAHNEFINAIKERSRAPLLFLIPTSSSRTPL